MYLYDEREIIGMVYTNASGVSNTYYFQRNLLGDVIGIYNASGNRVGGYVYDAWGNCTITLNTGNIATINPIRYRGYYYDEESELYYLNARYYSPTWRRFISPDDTAYLDPDSFNGLNQYCYCNNDPVNYVDPSGRGAIASLLISAVVLGLVSAGANALGQVVFDGATQETFQWEKVIIAGASGFLSGLIPGTGFLSILSQAVVSSAVDNILNTIWLGEEFNMLNVMGDIALSTAAGYAAKGIAHLTSKLTNRIFIKATNYAQYQHYFRLKGFDYSKAQVYKRIKLDMFFRDATNEILDKSTNFSLSFLLYLY